MSDLEELGKAFKKKFPQYRDLSDIEAGRAAKLAYPGAYDDIEDDEMDDNYQSRNTSLAPTCSRAGSYELEFEGFERWMQAEAGVNQLALNPGLMKQYEEVFNFYNPRGGWITRWFDEKRTESQQKIAANLNAVQAELLNAITRQAKAVHEQRKTAAEFFFYMQKNMGELRALQAKIEIATDTWTKYKMTPEDLSAANYQAMLNQIQQQAEEDKMRREKELEEWRRQQKIEAAHQFNERENAALNRMRNELEEAILDLAAHRKRTDLDAETLRDLETVKQNRIANLKFRISAKEKQIETDGR
jgi:hypothetical protein